MATGDKFLSSRGWTITDWIPLGIVVNRGIPEDAFPRENTILVGANPDRTTGLFNLHWLDATNNTCDITGISYDDSDGKLKGDINVNFGGHVVLCSIEISVEETELTRVMTGTLTLKESIFSGTDTTAGTFQAQASPEPPPPYDGAEAKRLSAANA